MPSIVPAADGTQPVSAAPRWSVDAFRAGSSAALLLRLLCPRDGFEAFACTWAYFRWADDRVDAPDRDPEAVRRFVARQEALLAGEREAGPREELALRTALAHPRLGAALARASRVMMEALRWDAHRGPEAQAGEALEAQIRRIGDGFAIALWACTGATGEPTGAARALAGAATAAHHVRDLWEDLGLGYCNVPAEELPAAPSQAWLVAWVARRAAEVDDRFAAALRGLRGLPWRTRLVFTLLGWRYRLGLRRWARRAATSWMPESAARLRPAPDR